MCYLFWLCMDTLIRGDFGNVIARKHSMPLGFILYIRNVGLLCFGIHVSNFFLEFTLMISRCQDHLRTSTRGGNSSPHKLIWTHLRTLVDTLVVNTFLNLMSNWTKQITPLLMFSMRVSLILQVSQPVRPAERGTSGSTCQSSEYMFIITCNLARSSRTSRRTLNPSGRERAG